MKIFDCFTFFNELELLDLRLMELYDTVDYFVLVESNKTHTGKDKEFIFEANKNKYKKYLDKIIYVKVEDLPTSRHRMDWTPEIFQRNCIERGLEKFVVGQDKIIVSDVDEIPNTDIINNYKNSTSPIIFEQSLFYYYVNCLQNQKWCGPIMSDYNFKTTPQQLREIARSCNNPIKNAGWHYSFMGGSQRIKLKVENITESPLIIDKVGNLNEIENKIKMQKDLWDRQEEYAKKQIIDINNNSPKKINEFLLKYPNFIFKG